MRILYLPQADIIFFFFFQAEDGIRDVAVTGVQTCALPISPYTTKELSRKTWPDFVRLFSQGSGWDFCQCMHFHRPRSLPKEQRVRTRGERGIRNRRQKRALVEQGCAHGILVYANGEPVGWCQYGPREELPRIDKQRDYQGRAPQGPEKLWRITCFAVLKPYRKRGVASAALRAALEAIRRGGGGLVEAYPITRWLTRALDRKSTRLNSSHGYISYAVFCLKKKNT